MRALITIGSEIAASVFTDEGLSARELVSRAEQKVFEIAERGTRGRDGAQSVRAMLPELIDKIDEWHSNPDKLRGLATGFLDFDRKTGGLRGGEARQVRGRGAQQGPRRPEGVLAASLPRPMAGVLES